MSPNTLKTLKNTAKAAFLSCLAAATLNATGNPAEWAKKKRYIAAGESPFSQDGRIKFSFEHSPWAEEPCREAVNPDTQVTALMWGSGMAKTLGVFANVLGWSIDEQPMHWLWALKTEDQMEEISKKQLRPMFAANPSLASKISPPKSRDSSNTILSVQFPGGSWSGIGTESITGFRANRSPGFIGDEIDSWKGEVAGEGDPLWLGFRRTDGFPRSIRLIGSTPGTKGNSRIEHWYEQSDKRQWRIPCRSCGLGNNHGHLILWANIIWPKGNPERAEWLCPQCGAAHSDKHRRDSVKAGFWHPTAPFRGIRGYWINGLNSLLPANKGFQHRLHQWAQEVTDIAHAKDPKEAKKVIVQTLFTETWQDEEDAKPDWEQFAKRREDFTHECLPNGIIKVTAGTDVQLDRLECTIGGHGRNGETWIIKKLVYQGDPSRMDFDNPTNVWNQLEAGMESLSLRREDKKVLHIAANGVDTSEPKTKKTAWEFIQPRQYSRTRWWAFRGSSRIDAKEVERPNKSKVTKVTIYLVGTNYIKGQIYDRANIETPGTRYIHIGKEIDNEWCQQLFAETSRPVWKDGIRYRQYECPKNTRNEGLDTTVYLLAAFANLGRVNWDYEEKNLKTEDQPTVQQEKPQPIARTVGGFVGGGGGWRI